MNLETVCKGYQQMRKVAASKVKEKVKAIIKMFSMSPVD